MKEFDIWNNKKKVINTEKVVRFFHEREIWWCSLGVNVGFEQDGKGEEFQRPVLILKKFNKDSFLGVPLTTKLKEGKYYIPIIDIEDKEVRAIISQIRFFDSKRLLIRIKKLTSNELEKVKQSIKDELF